MTHRLFHVPKWLLEEKRFRIQFERLGYTRFVLTLFDERNLTFHGLGNSIASAAKEARKKREAAEV